MKEFRGKPDTRLAFQCRPDGGTDTYKLILRHPFQSAELRELLGTALAQWKRDGRREPRQITLGRYTPHGFSPSRRWLSALELEAVADRIAYDLMRLYGEGGPYHQVPSDDT